VPDVQAGGPVSDWTRDPGWKRYAEHALTEMVPKLAGSSVAFSLVPQGGEYAQGDVKYWVELGAAIMLDKPIVVVAAPGQALPERLVRVADEVVRADLTTEAGQKEFSERMVLLADKHGIGPE
jgi:hypothetical protein